MKDILKLLTFSFVFYLLPLMVLAGLAGWLWSTIAGGSWLVLSFISFLVILFLLQTLDVLGMAGSGLKSFMNQFKKEPIKPPENNARDGT